MNLILTSLQNESKKTPLFLNDDKVDNFRLKGNGSPKINQNQIFDNTNETAQSNSHMNHNLGESGNMNNNNNMNMNYNENENVPMSIDNEVDLVN